MKEQHDLLNGGYVRLVDYMGNDFSVVRAARVSHARDHNADHDIEKDAKLIKYLWNHKHTTPFESCAVTFEVKAPIFVFRQWHRHRTQSYNEISARYTELPDEFYIPDVNMIGAQSKSTKQARDIHPIVGDHDEYDRRLRLISAYTAQCESSTQMYKSLLAAEWPRELARMVLPVSVYSRMYSTGNLLNWLKFTLLRSDEHAQYEIRVYSDAILATLRELFPMVMEAYDENEAP